MKRYLRSSQQQQSLHYKRGVPSKINEAFRRRHVDAAFISSIASRRCNCVDLGIVSRKEVRSVLLIPGKEKNDTASATSNVLAKVLGLEGQVIIGDNALRYYLDDSNEKAIDLAQLWYQRQKLPFVFARLCYHGHSKKYRSLSKQFLRTPKKIPQYLLETSSKKTQISKQEILEYLQLIEYRLDAHARLSLKRFLRLARTAQQ
jgi:chorismate dehydratase